MDVASDPGSPPALSRLSDGPPDADLTSRRASWTKAEERSVSRSSALSPAEEAVPPATATTTTTATVPGAANAAKLQPSASASPSPSPPAPAHSRTGGATPPFPDAKSRYQSLRVWRDPAPKALVNVQHVDSVQHRSLLMAHPGQPMAATTSVLASHPGLQPHAEILLKQRGYAAHQFSPPPHDLANRRDMVKRGEDQEERHQELNAEEAVHQHFEESLRLMQKQQQHQQHIQQQQRERAHQQKERDRCFYVTTQNRPRPTSSSTQLKASEDPMAKDSLTAARLPQMEPNFYTSGFTASDNTYTNSPYIKAKQELPKAIAVSNKSPTDGLALSSPLALMSDQKNSVIVKNDTKNASVSPHLQTQATPESQLCQAQASAQAKSLHNSLSYPAHPPSPKLAQAHFQSVPVSQKYEYRRSPQALLSHTPTSYAEPQNLTGISKNLNVSHHRQVSPSDYRSVSTADHRFVSRPTGYPCQQYPLTNVAPSKPKVSSPAPPHMYGEPCARIVSGTPMGRTVDNSACVPLPLTSKASSLQPVSSRLSPSPAHSTRTLGSANSAVGPSAGTGPPIVPGVYNPRMFPNATVKPPHHSAPPPNRESPLTFTSQHLSPHQSAGMGSISSALPSNLPTHPEAQRAFMAQEVNLASQSFQTQPLDLGVSSTDRALSPKRKMSPYLGLLPLDKKPRNDSGLPGPNQLLLSYASEPSPLMANSATTIATVANSAYCLAKASVASMAPSGTSLTALDDRFISTKNTGSTNGGAGGGPSGGPGGGSPTPMSPLFVLSLATSPVHLSARTPSPDSCSSTAALPVGPVLTSGSATSTTLTIPGVNVKSVISADNTDKCDTPVVRKPITSSYPVHKLKKAWLQRHSGEDVSEDKSDVVGSGSSVTLPVRIDAPVTPVLFTPVLVPSPPSASPTLSNETTRTTMPSQSPVGTIVSDSLPTSTTSSTTGLKTPQKPANVTLNGHAGKLDSDDTSGSESELKTAPARKTPKTNPMRDVSANASAAAPHEAARQKTQSESVSESGSDSGSDSGASSKKAANGNNTTIGKEARKRGRRPKPSKNKDGEQPLPKKSKDEPAPVVDPFQKPPIAQLKKTGENFLQDAACFEVAPKLAKCRECRWTPNQRSKNMPNIFCRFYAFRKLRYTKNGQLAIAGFSHPTQDALEDDRKLWLPLSDSPPGDLDVETSTFLLAQVGDQFCDLLQQEKEALEHHMGTNRMIAWKRVVHGVREMCDVCETTLFNFHWACSKCGFVVCLDCYKSRRDGTAKAFRSDGGRDRDDKSWLLCTNRQPHEQEKLMLTQIVAGDSLDDVNVRTHRLRSAFNIPQACGCPLSLSDTTNGLSEESNKGTESDDEKDAKFSTLRELLIRPAQKSNGSRASSPDNRPGFTPSVLTVPESEQSVSPGFNSSSKGTKLPRVKSDENNLGDCDSGNGCGGGAKEARELKHFVRRYLRGVNFRRDTPPPRFMTLAESQTLYPDVPHSWLCDGKLLKLSDVKNPANCRIFQDQWKRGQPVIVSDVSKSLDKDLWTPSSFIRDFGSEKNDLINCTTGNVLPNQSIRKFWEGFECVSKRLRDEDGKTMLLKLKDWPPGEDFAESMPTRFADLMQALPLSEYTHRNGRLNLASRLPECFVKPDLGPKMYIAYGSSALLPNKGTTNLHMDISDAVNVMVYVGVPRDGDDVKEAFKAIDDAGCDILTRRRVREKDELPGALWHIYSAQDADKIRDLLNKVALERGERLEPHHDPIHDQSWYLDGPLRERLYREYHVEGYTIVQCLGDAIFIPAGAPHQVRNLHNCIKVAEDFVSPENISHCFHLMQEFRALSHQHTNHEDKLQIKNIIYHAVKDSLSVLSHAVGVKEEPDDKGEQAREQTNQRISLLASIANSGDVKRASPLNGSFADKAEMDT